MAASESTQQERDNAKLEFVKRNSGLVTVPAKVMALADLEVLDLAYNEIEVVPKGLLPDIAHLKILNLSHNAIKALPEDIASLKSLEMLHVNNNCISTLPDGLFLLTAVRDINASCNQIDYISNRIGSMEGLQVLNLSGNKLRAIPSYVGWLGLKQLNISDNPDLNIPPHVLQCGFKAVMCYLQVIGEQHQLVATHMSSFTGRITELQDRHGLQLGNAEDAAGVSIRLKVAQRLGILSCSHCRLVVIPEGLSEQQPGLEAVQVVDFSHNALNAMPIQLLQRLGHLLVLNLSFNGIKTLPAGLGLSALGVLDMSFNKLVSVPADLGQQTPSLQQLYLANNYLTELPDSLQHATGLQDLFLSENSFGNVPEVLRKCTRLAKLSLAACQLTVVNDELEGLTGLRFLDISFNQIKALPSNMVTLGSLATLNLAYNPLGAFPEVLCSMTNLKELNIDQTGITSFPAGVGELRLLEGLQADNCPLLAPFASLYAKDPLLLVRIHDTRLQALDLAEAGLEEVPQQLLQLTQLTSLKLSKNSIKELPLALGDLRQLKQLSLKGNPLRQPYLKLLDAKGELPLLAFLRPEGAEGVLDVSGCGFEVVPKDVWELQGRSALMSLNLTNNRLRDLPQDLSSLVSLTQVVVDHNLLRHVPEVLLALPALAVLMASGNSITYLPEGIGQAQQLQALLLHSNQLMQLPESLTSLTNMRVLGLTSNRLWQLPAGIANCSSLRLLDCSHNLLSRLPEGMGKMSKLRSLKLTHNKLAWLPAADLQELSGLLELHVAGNVFTVDTEMNTSDAASVVQLLAAVAAGAAGHPPAQQPTYSRVPSSLYSNLNSYSPSIAESAGTYHSARSRLSEPATPTAGALKKGKQQASSKLAVMWDDHGSTSDRIGSGETSNADGAAASAAIAAESNNDRAVAIVPAALTRMSLDGTAPAGHVAGGQPISIQKHCITDGAAGSIRWSSDGSGFRRTSDGGRAMRRSAEGAHKGSGGGFKRHSLDGPKPAVHFADGKDSTEACGEVSISAGDLLSAHLTDDVLPAQGAACRQQVLSATQAEIRAVLAACAEDFTIDTDSTPAAAALQHDVGAHAGSMAAAPERATQPAATAAMPLVVPATTAVASAVPRAAAKDADRQGDEGAGMAPGKQHQPQATAASKLAGVGNQSSCFAAKSAAPAVAASVASSSLLTSNVRAPVDSCLSSIQAAASSPIPPGQHAMRAFDSKLAAPLLTSAIRAARQPSSWDQVPLMEIPRIIKTLAVNPPPPPPQPQAVLEVGTAAGQLHEVPAVRRPQPKARFARVIQQTQQALALLQTMDQAGNTASLN